MIKKLKIVFICAILFIPSLSNASAWNLWEVSRYFNDDAPAAQKEWQLLQSFKEHDDCELAKDVYINDFVETWKQIKIASGSNLQIIRKDDDKIILKNDDKLIEEKFVCLPKEERN